MHLTAIETAQLLLALILLLGGAHGFGHVFRRLRQPPVIGEILGGLLLGPTLFGWLAPRLQQTVFPEEGPVPLVLAAIYELGLLLLMFCSGSEIRSGSRGGERRTVMLTTLAGTLLPFIMGLLAFRVVDVDRHVGPAGNRASFLLVFAIAIAVTSIPVISRILYDLKLLETDFARIVLATAVIEDVILYIGLGVALSMAGAGGEGMVGVPSLLGLAPASAASLLYHTFVTVAFLGVALLFGPLLFRALEKFRYNLLQRGSPVAHLLTFLMAMTGAAIVLGIAPMFGAFVAGIVAAGGKERRERSRAAIQSFAFAFFIPIYFAIVGLKLDLVRSFDPLFFVGFLAFACAGKALSVYLGARLAGETPRGAINLGVALNARGGPGIVLASLAYDAAIINEGFYAVLVMLAIVTSLAAGSWLGAVKRSGRPLR